MKKRKLESQNGGKKPVACSMCDYRAAFKYLLRSHEVTHSKEKPIKCHFSGCTYACKLKKHLNQHVLHRHTAKTFKCDVKGCLSMAPSQSKLKDHKRRVHYKKAYKCSSCDFRAAIPSKLKSHIVVHKASKRFSCPNQGCSFRTSHPGSLSRHMQHHKADLGCPVEGCSYAGSSRSAWEKHMQLHDATGRPIACPLCPKLFTKNCLLLKHLGTHTNEKPLKCPACDFGSARQEDITKHVRAVHSAVFPEFEFDEKFTCAPCGISYGCALGLAMHRMKVHKTVVILLPKLNYSVPFGGSC